MLDNSTPPPPNHLDRLGRCELSAPPHHRSLPPHLPAEGEGEARGDDGMGGMNIKRGAEEVGMDRQRSGGVGGSRCV